MKAKGFVIGTLFTVIICLHLRIVLFPDGFGMPMNYQLSYFGSDYYELYSIQTSNEMDIGREIVDRVKSCMEYTGNKEDAPETDAVSRYYNWEHFERSACTRTEVDISLRKSVIHGDKGSVWINYSQAWFDENDVRIYGAYDILARCTIEKDNSGKWLVTAIHEPP